MSEPRWPARKRLTHLMAYWSPRERDVVFHHPTQKADGHLLYGALSYQTKLLEELERRGFDITTLRFEIALKPRPPVGEKSKPTPPTPAEDVPNPHPQGGEPR